MPSVHCTLSSCLKTPPYNLRYTLTISPGFRRTYAGGVREAGITGIDQISSFGAHTLHDCIPTHDHNVLTGDVIDGFPRSEHKDPACRARWNRPLRTQCLDFFGNFTPCRSDS
ncbi:uncharacterized [Tachysurus ichikawai]